MDRGRVRELWEAADEFTCDLDPKASGCTATGVSCGLCPMTRLRKAVENLRQEMVDHEPRG